MRVAEHHRNAVAEWVRVRPERVSRQPCHVQHRPEIHAAPHDRIGRRQRLDQPFDWHRQQRRKIGLGHPQLRQIGARAGCRIERPRRRHLLSAHRRCAVEQASGGGHPHHRRDLRAAARLAEHHDAGGITAERRDVVAHPLQREDQVELPRIATVWKPSVEPRQIQIPERVEPVVHRHDHDIAARRQRMPIVLRIGDAAVRIRATVDIDHHRLLRAQVGLGGPDVEEQAILGLRTVSARLRTDRPEIACRSRLSGHRHGYRRPKPLGTTVAYPLEGEDISVGCSHEVAGRSANRERCRRAGARREDQRSASTQSTAARPAVSGGHRAHPPDRHRYRLGGTGSHHPAANA